MSITAETAKEHAKDPAVLCCRAEGGITIQAANLEDPAIFDDLVDSGLLKLDGTLTIEQVLGAKLVKTCDSLTPLTADLVEGAKAPAAEEAPTEEAKEEVKEEEATETTEEVVEDETPKANQEKETETDRGRTPQSFRMVRLTARCSFEYPEGASPPHQTHSFPTRFYLYWRWQLGCGRMCGRIRQVEYRSLSLSGSAGNGLFRCL